MLPIVAIILSLGLGALGAKAEDPYTISPLNNTGILFEDIGELMVYHNTWSVLTELDLGELENQTALAEYAEHLVFKLCHNYTVAGDLCGTQQAHIHSVIENIKRRTATIKELVPRSRQPRSIFDGMGQAMHWLFGTMDHDNEVEVYSRLEELEKNEQALVELEKQQISVVKNTLSQIQKPLASLSDRQQQIAYQINDLLNITEDLSHRQLRQEIISNLVLQVVEVEFRQQALLDIIIASRNNQIHPLLVSPNHLLQVYSKAQTSCTKSQKCLSILYQTSEVRSHLLQDKLVIRIKLPILNMPSFKLQQVRSFPIQTKANHSLVPDIEFSHVASNLRTQEFLLLKPENTRHYKRVTYGLQEHTLIGRLNTPIIKAASSQDCIVKLIFNPLNETIRCNLRVQYPKRDLLIKLARPNTWLFSLVSAQIVHVTCVNRLATAKLTDQGTITINEPCQLQIGNKILHFDEEDRNPLKISQPAYFPLSNETNLSQKWESLFKESQTGHKAPLELISGETTNDLLHKGTQSLEELQAKLTKLDQHMFTQHARTISTTSISLTGALTFVIAAFVLIKYVYPPMARKARALRSQPQAEEPVIELEPIQENPSPTIPKPFKRSQSLPKPRSIQLV